MYRYIFWEIEFVSMFLCRIKEIRNREYKRKLRRNIVEIKYINCHYNSDTLFRMVLDFFYENELVNKTPLGKPGCFYYIAGLPFTLFIKTREPWKHLFYFLHVRRLQEYN